MFPYNGIRTVVVTPTSAIEEMQEVEAPTPLMTIFPAERASKEVWQYLADRKRLTNLVGVLPREAGGAAMLSAIEGSVWHAPLPLIPPLDRLEQTNEIPQPGIVPMVNVDQIHEVPAWDRDLDTLWEWLHAGRCDNSKWRELFGGNAGNCEGVTAATAIARDIARSLGIFRTSSTLRDVYTEDEAEAIYRLGRYMVEFNWGGIELALTDTCYAKPTCAQAMK